MNYFPRVRGSLFTATASLSAGSAQAFFTQIQAGLLMYLLIGALSLVLHVEGSRTRPSIIVVSRYGIFSLVLSFRRYGSPANTFHIPKSYSLIFSFTNRQLMRLWILISLFFQFVFENFILLCFHFSSLSAPKKHLVSNKEKKHTVIQIIVVVFFGLEI